MAWSSSSSCMAVLLALAISAQLGASDLSPNYYSSTCPNLESIVRGVVAQQRDATIRTIGSTIRLFFHDCFVEGCDGSVLISSTAGNTAERDADDNKSLAPEGFNTVNAVKTAVEAACPGQVSCADILTIAARDAIALSGGPSYPVELGRLDGLSSSASSVTGQLPHPTHTINQLTAIFRAQGLTRSNMVALSAAHTVGQAHCDKFSDRLYGNPADATLNPTYAAFLRSQCPPSGSPNPTVRMDQASPAQFDNQYVLPEPAGRRRPARLRPAAPHRQPHPHGRRRVGRQLRRLQPGLRRRHHQARPRRGQVRQPGQHTRAVRRLQLIKRPHPIKS